MTPKACSLAVSFGFFLIIIILTFSCSCSCSCFASKQDYKAEALACNQVDHDLLLSFFLSISSPPEQNPNSNFSKNTSSTTDCCLWEGISCNGQGRVTRLWLPSRELTGNLSPFLGNLTHLSHLNLSHNRLSGPLPPRFFSSLSHLEILDLSNNSFTGPLPSSICLRNSPPVIKLLDFSLNHFTGEIPPGFGSCSELEVLRASFNSLSGVLPDDIFKATTRLREISLPGNQLSGPIGDAIVRLSNLTVLDLHANQLTGNLPKDIGKLSNLAQLNLQLNNLTGTLPPSLMNCTNLVTLSLYYNFIEGDISADFNFSKFPRLGILDLGVNRFTGNNFPTSLYKCKSLTAIRLSRNQLKGQISPAIQSLRSLSFLSLGANGLVNATGALGILMGCKSLRTTILTGNFIGEAMPDGNSMNGVGFSNLEFLGLCGCQLTGQVPSWLVKLDKLVGLDLSINQLTGTIPGWLGNLPSLFYLDLSRNRLSGEFPREICGLNTLTYLEKEDARAAAHKINQSYMLLPIYNMPTNLSVLQYRRLSTIPPTINMASNNLRGNIPVEIGRLRLLHVFNLSHNNFSGDIPSQISRLADLEKLDLSGNRLSGEIPVTLSGLHFLSSFNVAYNNLQGKIPSGSQLDLFGSSSYVGNPELCGLPLPNACQVTAGGNGIQEEEEDGHEIPWLQIAVGLGYAAGFWAVCGPLVLNHTWRHAYFRFLNDMSDKVCGNIARLRRRL